MSATIITFPIVPNPSTVDWKLTRMDATFESPLSGARQDIVRAGALWHVDMSWHVLKYADSQLLAAWAAQMGRGNVRTALTNFAYTMQGSGSGTPEINGASQTGQTLATKGWAANATGVLKAGDMIEVTDGTKHQLLMVVADANANSSGDVTLSIEPALRISPTDSSAITISSPKAYFAFSKPMSSMSYSAPRIAAFSVSLTEDINQ